MPPNAACRGIPLFDYSVLNGGDDIRALPYWGEHYSGEAHARFCFDLNQLVRWLVRGARPVTRSVVYDRLSRLTKNPRAYRRMGNEATPIRRAGEPGLVYSAFVNQCAYGSMIELMRSLCTLGRRELAERGFRGLRIELSVVPPHMRVVSAAARSCPAYVESDCNAPGIVEHCAWKRGRTRASSACVPRSARRRGYSGVGSNSNDGGPGRTQGSRIPDHPLVADDRPRVSADPLLTYVSANSGGRWAIRR